MSFLDFFNFKYDKNWLKEWNRFSPVDLKEILGRRSRIKLSYFKPVCYEAYEFGRQQKKLTSLKDISKRTRKILDNYNMPKLVLYLSGKAGNTDVPEIRQTIKGLVRMRALMELQTPGKVYQALWYFIVEGVENEPEFLSVAFREIAQHSFDNKLFGLIDIYTNLAPEIQEKLQEEWLSIARNANRFDSHPEWSLFETDEDILAFVKLKSLQKKALKEDIIDDAYIAVLEKNISEIPHLGNFLLLYLYYSALEANPPEADAPIISKLLEKTVLSRELLLRLATVFAEAPAQHRVVVFSLFFNILKKYLETNRLDTELYEKILPLASRATFSKYRRFNELMLSRQIDFAHTPIEEVFPYLHSGIFFEYSEKDSTPAQLLQFQKETIKIQSQVITSEPVSLVVHGRLKFKIDQKLVGAKEVNETLRRKGVPYQWVSFYRQNLLDRLPVFLHSLLLNKKEYKLLENFIQQNSHYVKNNIFDAPDFSVIRSVEVPLINDLNVLQKIVTQNIGDQVFINDIRWKNIKTNIVDKFPDVKIWYEIMHHIISYTGSVKPSKTWWAKMQKLAGKLSPDAFEMGMLRLLFDVSKNPFWYQKSQVKALRGMIWATTLINPYDAVMYLEKILLMSYERPGGKGQPRSLSGASSAMSALIKIDTIDSYKALKLNYLNSDYERFTNQLLTALKEFEAQTELPIEKLREIE